MAKGRFITFEGGEGTGKTTQIKLLSEYLASKNISVVQTREPGGTEVGKEIRKLLLVGDVDKFDPISEALLYYADRREHLRQKILPALEEGKWVLSDRFADSTMAYQYYGYDKRVPKQVLEGLYKIVAGKFKPDLTVVLDIDPKIGLRRSMREENKEIRFEQRDLEFHNNLRQGFLEIAAAEPERFVVLDANKSIEALHKDVVKAVEKKMFNNNMARGFDTQNGRR